MVTKPEMARPSGDEGTSPSVEGRPTSVKQGDTPAGNSDNEGSERPVREKLKNTTITAPPAQTTDADQPMTEPQAPTKDAQSESPNDSDGERRGRNRRKRSFDDIGEENKDLKVDKPSRKRSRDSNVVDKPGIQRRKTSGEKDEATAESNGADKKSRTPSSSGNSDRKPLMSPKGKRNREEFEDEDSKVSVIPPEEEIKAKVTKDEQPKLKKHRESNSPEAEPSKESEPQKTDTKVCSLGLVRSRHCKVDADMCRSPKRVASPILPLRLPLPRWPQASLHRLLRSHRPRIVPSRRLDSVPWPPLLHQDLVPSDLLPSPLPACLVVLPRPPNPLLLDCQVAQRLPLVACLLTANHLLVLPLLLLQHSVRSVVDQS